MPLTKYHNILGSSGVNNELVAPGDNVSTIKFITIANTHASNEATVSLHLDSATAGTSFNILKSIKIPVGVTLALTSDEIPTFNNSTNGFGLYITVGATDAVDVIIN